MKSSKDLGSSATVSNKMPLSWMLISGAAGFAACLLLVGVFTVVQSRNSGGNAANASASGEQPSAAESKSRPDSPAESDVQTLPGPSSSPNAPLQIALLPETARTQSPGQAASDASHLIPRIDRQQPSVLGNNGAVDRLEAPAAFPAGMLSFLAGLDSLGAFRASDAIASLNRAIEADGENSGYYTARGAAYIVSEKMQNAIPDLERALALDPNNVLASRMLRLAYLMLGDQLKASTFYGHGSHQPTDFLITEVGTGYGNRMMAQQYRYQQDPRAKQQTAAAIQKLPTVASLVAGSFQTGDENSSKALYALGIEQINAKDFDAARRSFRDVIAKNPHDWSARYYYARSLLATGDPELARDELTFVLCWKRFLPEAFAVRAMCAARQRDFKLAQADLETARTLDSTKAVEAAAIVAQAEQQSRQTVPQDDDASWDRLMASARAGKSFDDLANAALELRRSVDARRLRWNEIYQQRLNELVAAARLSPGNADRLADVAEFLRDNREVPGIQVEPNGAVHSFRRQTEQTALWEIELADTLTHEALNADPQHARSWAIKSAILLHTYGKLDEAEQAAHVAVQFGPKLVAAHMSLSDCYGERAARLHEQAAAFRAPTTGTRQVRVVDSGGNFVHYESETYLVPASAENLARAEACDRQAAEYEQQEQVCLNDALAASKGTPQEPFYQALMLYLRKDYAGARPWLEKAVKQNPEDPTMRRRLANCLASLGLENESTEEFARAVNLQQTTGEVWLKVAWSKIERTAWNNARDALLRAKELDPSDARIAAYTGIIAELGTRDTAEADAANQTALAQEEARARANQTTFLAGKNAAGMISPEELGLSIVLRLKIARSVFHTNPAQAADYYLATAAAEQRLSEWNLVSTVLSTMLPFPGRDPKVPAAAPPLVTVLKNNRIFAGQALLNAGRVAEAAQQFAAAENFANRLPAGGTAYLDFELEPRYVPFRVSSMPIYATLVNSAALLQEGKKDEARLGLQKVRFYLANRTQEQRAVEDDPIPDLYSRLAPAVGLR